LDTRPRRRERVPARLLDFVRVNGDGSDSRAVLPTHPCAQEPSADRDTVLETARAWIVAQEC
jgi:hypothetical protein